MAKVTAQDIFNEIEKGMKADPTLPSKIGGVFHFKIDGKSWTVDLKNPGGAVKQAAPEKQDVTMVLGENDFVNLMTGKATGQNLFMQGKLKIQGNMGLAMKLEKLPRKPADAPSSPTPASAPKATSGASGFKSAAVFEELTKKISSNPDLVKQLGGIYQFDITKDGKTNSWWVDLKNGKGSTGEGKHEKPDCTLATSDDDFVGMMTGKLNSQQLFMQGKLKIKGNMGLAMKLNKLQSAKAAL